MPRTTLDADGNPTTSESLPFMPIAVDDLLAASLLMRDADFGIYARALLLSWTNGALSDETLLACSPIDRDDQRVKQVVAEKFEATASGFVNRRVERDYRRQLSKTENGRRGGQAKATAASERASESASESSSETPRTRTRTRTTTKPKSKTKTKQGKQRERGSRFVDFWSVVHKKIGKRAAETAFGRAVDRVADETDVYKGDAAEFIVDRMRLFASSDAGKRTGRFRDVAPIHPATWLNQGRYDDDPTEWGLPPPPSKPEPLTPDRARFVLIRTAKVNDARDYDDDRALAEYRKRFARKP